jgi:hypothetical protein
MSKLELAGTLKLSPARQMRQSLSPGRHTLSDFGICFLKNLHLKGAEAQRKAKKGERREV